MGSPADSLPRTPVCGSCGVVAPTRSTACASCDKPLSQPRVFAPITGDVYWVALRCTFPCRACGFPSPLDGVVTGQQLDCAQCGSLQRFDPGGWGEALTFAWEVGDLGGPSPEGRTPSATLWIGEDNPHADLGMTRTFADKKDDRMSTEACPGYPVCRACARPLEISVAGHGVDTRCGGCGASARYGVPTDVSSPGLVAVVSEEHRVGRVEVRVQTSAGVSALQCPQCGAALHSLGGPLAECSYCRTVAFIPPRARPRTGGKLVAPTVFWLAFRGPSPARLKLETPAAPDAKGLKLATAVLGRGLSPLPGIELAPRAPGVDVRQWALTLGLTALALGVGYLVMMGIDAIT